MDQPHNPSHAAPGGSAAPNGRTGVLRSGRRLLGIALFGALLVVAAITLDPRDSTATETERDWFNASSFPKIGELVGRNYVLQLFAAPEGTLYTVCSHEGDVLARDLTGEEVMQVFPDINVNLHAGPDTEAHAKDGADFVIMSADEGL